MKQIIHFSFPKYQIDNSFTRDCNITSAQNLPKLQRVFNQFICEIRKALLLVSIISLPFVLIAKNERPSVLSDIIGGSNYCSGDRVTLSIDVTSSQACTAGNKSATVTVNFYKNSTLSNSGGVLVFTETPYTASASTHTSDYTFTATSTDYYYVIVEYSSTGCSNAGSITTTTEQMTLVTVNSPSTAPITTGAQICVGSTATLSASGAISGQVYKWYDAVSGGTLLKTSTSDTDNTYITPVLSATTNYWVAIQGAAGCESTRTQATATFPVVSADDRTRAGTNTWIGHVFKRSDSSAGAPTDANAFTNYYGTITESEFFNESFGGTNVCLPLTATESSRSVYTEYFAVRYRMNSSKSGIYVAHIGSDDGVRMTVDGTLIYNRWVERGYVVDTLVLFTLTGTSNLLLEYYESGGGNQVSFQNLLKVPNNLTSGITQTICSASPSSQISGNNAFTDSPIGNRAIFTVSYQWQQATNSAGPWTDISTATSQNYTPSGLSEGTHYFRRKLTVLRTNPGAISVSAVDYSDIATVTVNPFPVITNPGAKTACESYTLPTIAGTNLSGNEAYFNNSQTLGGTKINGPITSTQTVWIYDANGTCSDEESFTVTIVSPATADDPTDVTCCGPYTLPSLTNGNYFTGPGGTGTSKLAGDVINASTTLYVFANGTTPCPDVDNSFTITINQFNMFVADATITPSGEHCPEFGGPFNPESDNYNPGVTEVVFKVTKDLSVTSSWNFDFSVDETVDVEVYDLVLTGNNSTISYSGADAGGTITAGDNTEVTFTFKIKNVPGTSLDVIFDVTSGTDGNCSETGVLTDNNKNHIINAMPAIGSVGGSN